MKHALTVTVCCVAIVVVGILSVQSYNHYKVRHELYEAKLASQQEATAKTAAAKATAEAAQQADLKRVCEQELSAYNALSVSARAKVVIPNCNLQFVN